MRQRSNGAAGRSNASYPKWILCLFFYLETRPIGLVLSFLTSPSLEKDEMGCRYPARTTLRNFTARRNRLNPAYRSLLRRENSLGPTTMDAFRIHSRVLIAGGVATALLSQPVARAEEHGG